MSLLGQSGCAFLLLLSGVRVGAATKLLDTSVSCDQVSQGTHATVTFQNNFVLSLNFDNEFRGIVYSEEGFPNCVYVNGTMLSQRSYQLKVPLIGCETRTNQDGNFENAIIVQENSGFLQSTDKKYLLTCIPSTITVGPQRESLITVDFGGVTVDNSKTTTEVISAALPPGVSNPALKYTVEVRAGHSLESPSLFNSLNIGDPISYVVRIQKPVSDTQIGRCWASDSKSNLELSDEHGCSLQPRASIWNSFERTESADEVLFVNRIKAWAFPTSDEVNIFCNLRVCMSRACDFSNCTMSTKRARRHRLYSQGELASVERLSTQLRFRRHALPSVSATDLLTQNETVPEDKLVCLSSSHLALLAACILVLLILVGICVVFVIPSNLSKGFDA